MAQLADRVKAEDPELAVFLTDSRFVDNLNDSLKDIASAHRLQQAVNEAFSLTWSKDKGLGYIRPRPSPRNIRGRICRGSWKCMAPPDRHTRAQVTTPTFRAYN